MKNLNKVKTIFFDLDHTLWDFDRNSSLAFKHIFNIYDFPFSHSEFLKWYVPINHKYWRDYSENKISKEKLRIRSLQKTFNCLNFNYKAEYINEISNEYIKTLPTKTFLFEGVIDLLEKLKPIYDLHIISNGFEDVQYKKMKLSGLLPFFDKIITSENANSKKPDSKIFNYALRLTNENPQNCLMIGDNLIADILGAINVGMNAIHYNSNNESIHYKCPIVSSYKDLDKLLI
ncbi:MAG: YjjG family noncanonical pyrimidine nucleotidase [Flavobacteriaceae bacterium]|nr:YjjG family noncanonical pyrimidine nucleotidase [Flavobacteriaceae bacterium]